jgi:hypothetical protein
MKKILVNYNFTPDKEWIGDDYIIYDRSDDGVDHLKDFDQTKAIKTENVGQVDYDKLYYLVDNYDTLPEVFLWGKTNLFKNDPFEERHVSSHIYMTKEEYDEVKDNQFFTPILTKNHRTYSDSAGMVCFYEGGIYYERNPLWYYSNYKYCKDYAEFANYMQLPNPAYLPFAPGGNYILTKECVWKYSRDYYKKMADLLPYCADPLEAHFCERSYYTLWK